MSSIKNNILYFIIVSFLVQVRSLVEVPSEEAVEIVAVESSIRKVVNEIFLALKLEDVKHKTRIKEFSTIHNFFVTITLQDQINLKEIAALVKVDNVDNKTQHFITQINEVLNEDNKSDEANDDVYVTTHIETFIKKLEYLKDKYGFTSNDPNFGINAEILQHLKRDEASNNTTQEPDDNNVLSDLEVWQPSSRRVYQGHRGKIKRFPFVASVQFFKKFQCGGSIIKSDLVITSASCLQLAWNNRFFRENPAFLSVQVGSDVYEGGDENIPIQEVYFHPEYNPKNLRNNLAIMRLLRFLKFGKKVKKVKKIDFDREPSALPDNTDGITIIGWGARTSSNIINNVWTNRLAYAELDFYPLRECQDVYSKDYVTYKNFCAGFFSKGGGACNRDVGGPGVANGILMGVVSFGSPTCGAPDSPTVFTKLGYYTTWIEGILEMETPTGKMRTTLRSTRRPFKVEHYMTTRSHFRLDPVTETTTRDPYIISPVPINSLDALRALNESKHFKEFISTMFGSEEVKEYLDQNDYTTDKFSEDEEKLNREAEMLLEMMRMRINTAPTVRPTVANKTTASTEVDSDKDYKMASVEMVTSMVDFDFSGDTGKSQTTPNLFIDYKALPVSDVKIEEKIAKLIDEIDIQELLKSVSSDSSADLGEEIKPVAITTRVPINEGVRVVYPNNIDKNSSENDDDDDEDDDDDDSDDDDEDDDDGDDEAEPGDPFLNLVDLVHEVSALNQKQARQQHQQQEHRQKEHQQKEHRQKERQQKEHRPKEHRQNEHRQNEHRQKEHRQKDHRQKHHQQKEQQPYHQQQSEQGLSIPAASFKDFTFRQNSSNSGSILDLFNQNDLMRLLSEVVADVTKGDPSDHDEDYDTFN